MFVLYIREDEIDHPFSPSFGWCSLKLLVTACTFEKVIFVSAVLSPLERMITSSIGGMHHSRTRTQGWINLMRNPVTEIHNLGTQRENHIPPQVANSNIKGPRCYRTSSESCYVLILRAGLYTCDISINFKECSALFYKDILEYFIYCNNDINYI